MTCVRSNLLALMMLVSISAQFPAQASEETIEKLPEIKLDYIGQDPDIKERPILLEFWATWCPPCRANIPHLNELHEKFSPKGLIIVGVTDEEKSLVRKFSRQHKIAYTLAIDKEDFLAKHFNVKGIPYAVLADKSGRVIWKGHPAKLTEDIISQAL